MMQSKYLHVLCGEKSGIRFPLSIFVEPIATEDKEGAYITVDGVTDEVIMENEESLHYVEWDEALVKWPVLGVLLKNAKKLGAV